MIAVARKAFAEHGPQTSLDQIAREAGVGIGTLYRHFPNRAAIVEAMYRRQVDDLTDAATKFAATLSPVEALREWMRLFVAHIATKRLIADVLQDLTTDAPAIRASSSAQIQRAIVMLVDRGVASGEFELEMEPLDLLRALSGVVDTDGGRDWEPSARRLIDVMIAGMRVRRPRAKAKRA